METWVKTETSVHNGREFTTVMTTAKPHGELISLERFIDGQRTEEGSWFEQRISARHMDGED